MSQKVALVTGSATGVGRACAVRFAKLGFAVAVNYSKSEADAAETAELVRAAGAPVKVYRASVGADAAVRAMVADVVAAFGGLDVLVNNASSFFPVPLGEVEASHWEELIGSNLKAPIFIAQQAAPELAKREGAIVNVVDIHADRPLKGYPVYSIAKAGLAALTRSLALELAPRVRVNGVSPGAIAWPDDGQFDPAERSRILATTPLARTGAPEDIAQAVHFLATAPYVTGQILAVDGGRSIYL